MLSASNVRYVLPEGRELFSGVSLDVSAGEAVVIEGPSGVGKSTLLAILGGLLTPSDGEVTLNGDQRAPFVWVLQGLNTLGARTVLENVCINYVIDGTSKRQARRDASEALRLLGLEAFESSRARLLSGGELQRLSVARAIASRRPVVLSDEPTSHLDRANASLVMRELVGLANKSGRVVVIVTHDVESVPAGCRRLRLTADGLRDVATVSK